LFKLNLLSTAESNMTNQDNKSIDNMDLFRNQYTEKVLMDSIDKLSTYDIVRTQQNLSKEFIRQYILNSTYNDEVTLETLQNYQPQYFS
jgi:hypothetical protein